MPVFQPSQDALDALAATAPQVDGVVVVDDGSGPSAQAVLRRLGDEGAFVRAGAANEGIGAALNAGISIARERGATHVLFVDQDSRPPKGFVAELLETMRRATESGDVVGSVVPEFFSELRQAQEGPHGRLDALNGIQSGMLVPLSVFEEVGPLRADFFIDLVDTEFELRLRKHGFLTLAAPGLRLEHQLGHRYRRDRWRSCYRFATLAPEVTLSAPFRYYYRLRNRIALNRRYFWRSPWRRGKETLADLIHFADTIGLATDRRAMARIYLRAARDGLLHRMGKIPADTATIAARIEWRATRTDLTAEE